MVAKTTASCHIPQVSIVLKHPSIQWLLSEYLLKAWGLTFPFLTFIPLYRLKHPHCFVYRCSSALQLAKVLSLSPWAIAQDLLLMMGEGWGEGFLNVVVHESGVMDFYVGDRALILWLEQFPQLFLNTFRDSKAIANSNKVNLFPIQYVHNRCCALLRLGTQEGLIEVMTSELDQPLWCWKSPDPISWITLVSLIHPTERELIRQIFALVDDIEAIEPKHTIKLATQLSQAFLEFDRCCRIWGEVKQENVTLAQTRLGLVALTQLMLRSLLKEQFQVVPLTEL